MPTAHCTQLLGKVIFIHDIFFRANWAVLLGTLAAVLVVGAVVVASLVQNRRGK